MIYLDNAASTIIHEDVVQEMLPFLKELVNDERMPLIARNHASRLMKKIETSKKKVEEPAPEQ